MILVRKSVGEVRAVGGLRANEPTLWKRSHPLVDVFLGESLKQGALVGAAQDEAYYVSATRSNPPEARDAASCSARSGSPR